MGIKRIIKFSYHITPIKSVY